MTDVASYPKVSINITQACALAGVSRRTIYNWIAAGKLTYWRTPGGSVRIEPSSLFSKGQAPGPTP